MRDEDPKWNPFHPDWLPKVRNNDVFVYGHGWMQPEEQFNLPAVPE
jgi:hypothetical protein